jgi:hypothetical protein
MRRRYRLRIFNDLQSGFIYVLYEALCLILVSASAQTRTGLGFKQTSHAERSRSTLRLHKAYTQARLTLDSAQGDRDFCVR